MVPHSRLCGACGIRATVDLPVNIEGMQQPHLSRMSKFFASQATLCLFTLLVFLGLVVALAPAGWRYAYMQFKPSNGPQTASNDNRGLGA